MPALLWARLYKSAGVAGVSQHEAGSEDQGAARCQSEPGRCPSGKTERHAREHVPEPERNGRRVAGGDEKTVRPCLRPLYDGPDEERREWLLWALILIRGGYKPEGAASICDLQKRPPMKRDHNLSPTNRYRVEYPSVYRSNRYRFTPPRAPS
jgi:hypothetical protein